jgi:arylsulfatase A-like enzyme
MQMKISYTALILLCIFQLNAIGQTSKAKPNIILFLVDDMGWEDTSVPFWDKITASNNLYRTPNMVKLAAKGVKFTNAYATPVCTPTRVSLMSGMNAAHHRVTNWTSVQKDTNSDYPDSLYNAVPWNINGLSPQPNIKNTVYVTPLPQLLKNAGYYTIHCGKAHFASKGTPGSNPINLGFDINIAGSEIGSPASYLSEKEYGNTPINGKVSLNAVPGLEKYYNTHTFLSEALTLEALKALEIPQSKSKPFFLYMAQYAVHIPFDGDNRFLKKYEGLSKGEAAYATLIEGMDKSLGDIMDWLDKNKLTDNTVIMFMSDNGGLSRVPPRSGIAHTQNYPLKAGKGSVYEGGIREPMIVSWPGVIKPATISKRYLLIEDFFPTILDIASVKNRNTVQKTDGQSFLASLKDPSLTDNKRVLIWRYPNRWVPEDAPGISWFSALRQENWKLVYDYKKHQAELYNLESDIGEQHNLSKKLPEKSKELTALLTKYLKKYKAQLPVNKITGKMIAWPDGSL